MASSRGLRLLRSDRNEDPLYRVRRGLQDEELAVLDSLPAPDSYQFESSRKSGHATIELRLGERTRVDGTPCQAWARIVAADERDLQPPVVFYDQLQATPKDGTRRMQYPRSATSLLYKATKLIPPFCFLQHDPIDEVENARNMLCAIILYQALATRVDTCALHWLQFGDSLNQALRYIHSCHAYHQWLHEGKLGAIRLSSKQGIVNDAEKDTVDAQNDDTAVNEPYTGGENSEERFTGGVVRPCKGITVKPNTSLARLKDELGEKRSQLLDQIPPLPMNIEPHNLGSPYFPFRMLVGKHTTGSGVLFKVYAYLEHDKTKTAAMRFLGHDQTGRTQNYTMDQLLGSTLIQPLEYLNISKDKTYADGSGTSARTAKIRSVISYYFFLAENEGLIGAPRVTIGEAFGKRLCAAIKELQSANFGDNDKDACDEPDDSEDDDTGKDVPISKSTRYAAARVATETELTREEDSGLEPFRSLAAMARPETPAEAASLLQLEIRPSAQDTLEPSVGTATARIEQIHANLSSVHAAGVKSTDSTNDEAPGTTPVPEDDQLASSHTADVDVIRVRNRKLPSSDGSAEREMKTQTAQTASSSALETPRRGPVVIDLCSDGEDNATSFSNDPIDLTQSSPPARGKKGKSMRNGQIHKIGDEALEETDSNAHHRAQLRRRKYDIFART